MAWRFCLPQQRALCYTHVNSGSLPCAPLCGDPLYHMLETPTFPSTVLSTLWSSGVSHKKKNLIVPMLQSFIQYQENTQDNTRKQKWTDLVPIDMNRWGHWGKHCN